LCVCFGKLLNTGTCTSISWIYRKGYM